jgi:hypothetical protein
MLSSGDKRYLGKRLGGTGRLGGMGKGQRDGGRKPAMPRKRARPARNGRADDSDDFAPFAAWDGDDFGRIYGDYEDDERDEPGDIRRATVVVPAITLPSMPSVSAVRRPPVEEYPQSSRAPHAPPQRALIRDAREQSLETSDPRRRQQAMVATGKKPKVPDGVDVVLVPGGGSQRRMRQRMRGIGQRMAGPLHTVRRHRKALTVFALVIMLATVVANTTGLLSTVGVFSENQWTALANFGGPAPTATPRPAPDITDASHYVAKYGFDFPGTPRSIPSAEWSRLVYMMPFAYKATAAYDRRYHENIEPEMLVWWTHAEGITGHINYSNCANNPPRSGYSYFSNIENCPHASFWQLGYGNQFSVIYVLKNAFTDLYGDPNDAELVQKVGQWVLNFDRKQGTYPVCGGYSCNFPARTINSIMSGINTTLGVETADNWWASVLSRDPAINCYMITHALTYFNHDATKSWHGNYYYEPYWGYESNKLGDILAAWPALRRAAHL